MELESQMNTTNKSQQAAITPSSSSGNTQNVRSECGKPTSVWTSNPLIDRYEIKVWHSGLNKVQMIRADSKQLTEEKAKAKMAQWDQLWAKQQEAEDRKRSKEEKARDQEAKTETASQRTSEVRKRINEINTLLNYSLLTKRTIDFSPPSRPEFSPQPVMPQLPQPPRGPQYPLEPRKPQFDSMDNSGELTNKMGIVAAPTITDSKYILRLTILDRVFRSRRLEKERKLREAFDLDLSKWETEFRTRRDLMENEYQLHYSAWKNECAAIKQKYEDQVRNYELEKQRTEQAHKQAIIVWEQEREKYFQRIEEEKKQYLKFQQSYFAHETSSVITVAENILKQSHYPDYFPMDFQLEFVQQTGLIIVDFRLPSPSDLPRTKEIRYVVSKDEFQDISFSDKEFFQMYDNCIYQILFRVIYEIYSMDSADAFKQICFNGYVHTADPSTGHAGYLCIVSIVTRKDEFTAVKLDSVDFPSCFRNFKGVGSSRLHNLEPVNPFIVIERNYP